MRGRNEGARGAVVVVWRLWLCGASGVVTRS